MMATRGGCAFGVGHNAARRGTTPGRAGPGLDMVQPGRLGEVPALAGIDDADRKPMRMQRMDEGTAGTHGSVKSSVGSGPHSQLHQPPTNENSRR